MRRTKFYATKWHMAMGVALAAGLSSSHVWRAAFGPL